MYFITIHYDRCLRTFYEFPPKLCSPYFHKSLEQLEYASVFDQSKRRVSLEILFSPSSCYFDSYILELQNKGNEKKRRGEGEGNTEKIFKVCPQNKSWMEEEEWDRGRKKQTSYGDEESKERRRELKRLSLNLQSHIHRKIYVLPKVFEVFAHETPS